jgi:hypothetical protein
MTSLPSSKSHVVILFSPQFLYNYVYTDKHDISTFIQVTRRDIVSPQFLYNYVYTDKHDISTFTINMTSLPSSKSHVVILFSPQFLYNYVYTDKHDISTFIQVTRRDIVFPAFLI